MFKARTPRHDALAAAAAAACFSTSEKMFFAMSEDGKSGNTII